MPQEITPVSIEQFSLAVGKTEGLLFKGPYKGNSGGLIPIYFDLRNFQSFPWTLKKIAVEAYLHLLRPLDFDMIADVPYGATATISSVCDRISEERQKDVGQITAELQTKDHGSGKGYKGLIRGRIAAVGEDTSNTGRSALAVVKFWESRDVKVNDVVALVDYQKGARELLESKGLRYHSFCNAADVYKINYRAGEITGEQLRIAQDFFRFD